MQILFGGTFDPVHNGHVAMMDALSAAFPHALVHVIPNRLPPHRQTVADSGHRLAMLDLLLSGYERITVDRIEMERDGPSYTVDTLRAFRAEYGPDEPLVLSMGADAARGLARWHQPERIAELAHVCILDRDGQTAETPEVLASMRPVNSINALADSAFGCLCRLQTPAVPTSSTEVRGLIAEGVETLPVPKEIHDYISNHNLYRTVND